jgi:transcriptional regulator with XRE-family HTH domain
MSDITNNEWISMSDTALLATIGAFVKHKRVEQNKTQAQLAQDAGINRSTLSLFENGDSSNMLTFIQVMRALKLLPMLNEFQVTKQLSPLLLAKLEKSQKIRASRAAKQISKPKSDW